MTRRWPIALAWVAVAAASLTARMDRELPAPLTQFLSGDMKWSASELAAVRRGEVVASLPDTAETRELSSLGVVYVAAPASALASAMADIVTFKRGEGVLQIGRLSDVPQLADLAGMTLEPGDLEALRECRPADCDLKLSAAMMERVRRDVRWDAADWRVQAAASFKQALLDYVTAYVRDGNDALIEYADKQPPVRLAEEVRALIRETPYVRASAPAVLTALDARRGGGRRLIYWSKEQYGYKPTITVTELSVFDRDGGGLITASKQLYATHYFEGSLGMSVATPLGGPDDGFFLMHLNRSRIDSLRGPLGGMKRMLGARRLRRAMEDTLRQAKARVEAFPATPLLHESAHLYEGSDPFVPLARGQTPFVPWLDYSSGRLASW